MGSITPRVIEDFDERQAAHICILLGRISALAVLVDALWTNELAKESDPLEAAREFKTKVLDLIDYDPDDVVESAAFDELTERLDSILFRVESLN